MGLVRQFLVLFVACCSLFCYTLYCDLTKPLPVPQLNLDEYWGPGEAAKYREDTKIRPFNVSYDASVLLTLRQKLKDLPKLTPPLEDAGPFEYGFNSDRLKEILLYWRTNYLERWPDRERYLNQFPHFKTQIQGLDVHFIHVRPTEIQPSTKVLPLLLLHGWPGSVREFYELIPRLTKPVTDEGRNFVFEVIAPSLPGYGWSQSSAKKGLGAKKIAVIMKNLMARVGHKRFYVHGGDWGALVTDLMGTFFQEDIIGMHQSGCGVAGTMATVKTIIASFAPSYFIEEQYIPFYYPFKTYFQEMVLESGYMHLQATKPDTIGAVLVGNPVGLAAYILEKFSTWTNKDFRALRDGGLEKFFTLDALLDNVMIYYLTDSITTSQRLYAEVFSVDDLFSGELGRMATVVPSACAKFRHDLLHTIDWALRDHYRNLIQSNHYEDGGHFSSMQLPEVMYKDLVQFVEKVENLSHVS